MKNAITLADVVADPALTAEACRVVVYVWSLGEGWHEIEAGTLRALLGRGDGSPCGTRKLREAIRVASEAGYIERQEGGRGHSPRFRVTFRGAKNAHLKDRGAENAHLSTDRGAETAHLSDSSAFLVHLSDSRAENAHLNGEGMDRGAENAHLNGEGADRCAETAHLNGEREEKGGTIGGVEEGESSGNLTLPLPGVYHPPSSEKKKKESSPPTPPSLPEGGAALAEAKAKPTATAPYSEAFEMAWKAYPKRHGGNSKKAAWKAWTARLRQKVSEQDLIEGVKRYAAYVRAEGMEGTRFVMQAATFFGPGEHWSEPWEVDAPLASPQVDEGVIDRLLALYSSLGLFGIPLEGARRREAISTLTLLVAQHGAEMVEQAMRGMPMLFPYCEGEPWSLQRLMARFTEAAAKHAAVERAKRTGDLDALPAPVRAEASVEVRRQQEARREQAEQEAERLHREAVARWEAEIVAAFKKEPKEERRRIFEAAKSAVDALPLGKLDEEKKQAMIRELAMANYGRQIGKPQPRRMAIINY